MPLSYVDISAEPAFSWSTLRQAIADCIATVVKPATGARIYPNWIYEMDVQTMLGKVTAPMRATSGTSNAKVHCYTIGISQAMHQRDANGRNPIVGGQNTRWTWDLTIDVWGLFEYDGTAAMQKSAEDEARLVSAALFRNADIMVAGMSELSHVGPLQFPTIQPMPMSGGQSLTVASGVMLASVNEALGI